MQLSLEIKGLEKVQEQLKRLSQGGIKQAAAKALNDTAFKVRKTMQDQMKSVFHEPTPFILKSVQFKSATPDALEVTIQPTYMGGKSVEPQKILAAEVFGGRRRDKRSEVALRNAGILPRGYQTAIPETPFPGSDDGRGNLRGPFMVQLISYFQAFSEQGYSANMTKKRKEKLANRGLNKNGYKTINGFIYFLSRPQNMKGVFDHKERTLHLAPGIWAKSGTHGCNVRPVLMFVRTPRYAPRLSMEEVATKSNPHAEFEKRMRYHIRTAVENMGS